MKKTGNAETAKKVLRRIGRYKWFLLLSVLLAATAVSFTLYIPILIGRAIDCIAGAGQVDFGGLKPYLVKIAAFAGAVGLVQWLMNTVNNRIAFYVIRDVRNEAFERIQSLPLKFLDSRSAGDTLNRVTADADQFADGLLIGFTQLFTGMATILGTLGFMLAVNWKIALVVVILTPLSLFVARFIASKTYHLFLEQSKTRAEQTAFVEEMIGEAKTVAAFSRAEAAGQQFEEINDRLEKTSLKATFFSSLTNPTTRFVNSAVYAAVALTGGLAAAGVGFFAVGGAFTVGALSSLLAYANQYTKPFNEISGVITELQNAFACAERLFELIEEPAETPDAPGAARLENVAGNVSLENVEFSYQPERPLIRDFNLSVKPGQRIAIVGPTGCGKTTLINLLMRFYDVNGGSIRVEGEDIREVTRESLRKSYGMVLQDTWLRSGTIRENILIGNPDATEEEMWEALRIAQAEEFVKKKDGGLDAIVEQGGRNLSGGQKQRLSIARAVIKKPEILILDDSSSALDFATDAALRKALHSLSGNVTLFIVSQRATTLMHSDKIMVLDDGECAGLGTHEELLATSAVYKEIYESTERKAGE